MWQRNHAHHPQLQLSMADEEEKKSEQVGKGRLNTNEDIQYGIIIVLNKKP